MRLQAQSIPNSDRGASSRSRAGLRSLALVLLTCGFLMVGATPGVSEVIASESDSCCECESIECLAVSSATAQHRRDGVRGRAMRLATPHGDATPGRRRTAAAPLHGHRLTNGQMAPLRL